MILFTIIITIIIFIAIFNLFVYFVWKKIIRLEKIVIDLFKSRNNQVVWIYQVARDDLVRWNEIFKEFFELKRRDFWEDSFNTRLEDKLLTYKKIHNEINFIFKTCEKRRSIQTNPIYLYLKDLTYSKSQEIWEKMNLYEDIIKKYNNYKSISHFTIIGYLY
jgi:hypothetical protein